MFWSDWMIKTENSYLEKKLRTIIKDSKFTRLVAFSLSGAKRSLNTGNYANSENLRNHRMRN